MCYSEILLSAKFAGKTTMKIGLAVVNFSMLAVLELILHLPYPDLFVANELCGDNTQCQFHPCLEFDKFS